jgi:26S proteasome regulatory subunit N7
MQRDLKQAAKLFLKSVATFTTYELCTFNELILYTVITSVLTLDRVDLRKQVRASAAMWYAK